MVTDVSKTAHSALEKKINKIVQNNWETVFKTENMPFSVAGIILPNETLNPDLLQLVGDTQQLYACSIVV